MTMTMSKPASKYYADIMSDDTETTGMGGGVCGGTRASAVSKGTTAFFAAKRAGTKEQVCGVEGMDSAVIVTVGARSRGIRPWEKARYEAKEQRWRETEKRRLHQAVRVASREAVRVVQQQQPAKATESYTMPYSSSSTMSTATSSTAYLAASVANTVLDGWDD